MSASSLANLLEGVIQSNGHGVEAFRQTIHFVTAMTSRQGLAQIVRLDALYALREILDRLERLPHQPPAAAQEDRDHAIEKDLGDFAH